MQIKKAIILAGGRGERLRPLTDETPKPLLKVRGSPILSHIMNNCRQHGIRELHLSLGYGAKQIEEFYKGKNDIYFHIEKKPLGTGGAIRAVATDFDEPFLVLNGDNLADFNIGMMGDVFEHMQADIVIGLVQVKDVSSYGVANLAGDKLVGFVEKPMPAQAPSNWINAGAYVFHPRVIDLLPKEGSVETDCFAQLAGPTGRVFAFQHRGQWYPTDTIERYERANKEFLP